MNVNNLIYLGSITNAMKGRDVLMNYRISSNIEKLPKNLSPNGCGYALNVPQRYEEAIEILKKSGLIKMDSKWKEMPP